MEFSLLLPLSAVLGFLVGLLARRSTHASTGENEDKTYPAESARTAFLFEGDELVDATPSARSLLKGLDVFGSPKAGLISLCSAQYPDLENTWENINSLETAVLQDQETKVCDLEISKVGRRVSIRLLDGPNFRGKTIQEDLLASRVAYLNKVISLSPFLIWLEQNSGALLWSNQRFLDYRNLNSKPRYDIPTLNDRRIFPDLVEPSTEMNVAAQSRHSIVAKDEQKEHWFNITSFPISEGALHFAADANQEVAAVRSQKSTLRTFVQIFAQLSIGFAIFDEYRQLQIYNPAFSDFTGLDAGFLSSRPTLVRIVDEMRNSQLAPETKNYEDFRQSVHDLEDTIKNGSYEDIWSMSDGQSLRITARPYDGGSIAFLIEDISAEISLTRKFRSEAQSYLQLIETIDDAIFIFAQTGQLILANGQGQELLKIENIDTVQIADFWERLKNIALPNPKIRLLQLGRATSIAKTRTAIQIHLKDGRFMTLKSDPLAEGKRLFRITNSEPQTSELPKVVQTKLKHKAQ